ncbi:hypothetical protein U9M48_043043 [Paspalum notatum var. saurae]|uniref:Integrase catalytic domain-containing protein n=1 Tax=Paspalum notatum var. saurae TaxID=547442 RepID=A0AAQ3USM7_PASNO
MLRACAIRYGTSWDKCLPYAEFSYNNSYQAGPKKSPFEALYGKRCERRCYGIGHGERQVFGLDIIRDAEQQLRIVRENLRVARSGQKLCDVSPMRGIRRFNMKGKLAPRYIGPFKMFGKERANITRRIGGTGRIDLHEHPVKILDTSRGIPKQKDQDVPCAMESSYEARGNMGTRG